jgi:predicted nucleic acid-binding Zn ribbon protein
MRGYRAKNYLVKRYFQCQHCKVEWLIGTDAHPRARRYCSRKCRDAAYYRRKTGAKKLPLLIMKIYANHLAGGNLHIVLDDENITDRDIKFCLALPDITSDERECAEILLTLPESERLKLVKQYV